MHYRFARDTIVRLTGIVLMLASSVAQASYAQFCRLEGEVLTEPEESNCCVEFEFLVMAAAPYTDDIFGEGWDNCEEHVGTTIDVQLESPSPDDGGLAVGELRVIWRDAIDIMIDGEMCTVVGFSSVHPGAEASD